MFIQIIKPSDKLNFTKLEPFKTIKILELITYELDLPDSIRITKIYYILILKLADLEALLIKNIPDINFKSQEKV